MRTREQILRVEANYSEKMPKDIAVEGIEARLSSQENGATTQNLTLEVLLDIRDLLVDLRHVHGTD